MDNASRSAAAANRYAKTGEWNLKNTIKQLEFELDWIKLTIFEYKYTYLNNCKLIELNWTLLNVIYTIKTSINLKEL